MPICLFLTMTSSPATNNFLAATDGILGLQLILSTYNVMLYIYSYLLNAQGNKKNQVNINTCEVSVELDNADIFFVFHFYNLSNH